MLLYQQIQNDIVTSMRKKEAERLSVLRMLKASFKNFIIAQKIDEVALTDDTIIPLLRSEIKKRKEASATFSQGGRDDLACKEKREIEIISAYLPASMSEEEIDTTIRQAVQESGMDAPYDFGKLMGLAMKIVSGRADGKTVKKCVEKYMQSD